MQDTFSKIDALQMGLHNIQLMINLCKTTHKIPANMQTHTPCCGVAEYKLAAFRQEKVLSLLRTLISLPTALFYLCRKKVFLFEYANYPRTITLWSDFMVHCSTYTGRKRFYFSMLADQGQLHSDNSLRFNKLKVFSVEGLAVIGTAS